MGRQFIEMFKKNIKILVNNKVSFSILFLGPILLLLLMTLMYYNENSYSFQVGVINSIGSETEEIINSELNLNGFYIVNYDSKNQCIVALQEARVQSCIIYPENFNIEKGRENEIIILVDNSKAQVKEVVENILRTTLQGGSYALSKKHINDLIENLEYLEETLNTSISTNTNKQVQVQEIKNTITLIRNDVLKADLAYNPNTLDLDEIETGAEQLLKSKTNFVNSINDELKDALNKTIEVTSLIKLENISDEKKQEIDDALDLIKDNVDLAQRSLESYGSSSYTFTTFEKKLTSLIDDLDDVEQDLSSSFRSQKSSIEKGFDQVETLDSSIESQSQIHLASLNQTQSYNLRDADTLLTPVSLTFEDAFKSSNSKLGSLFPFIFGTLILLLSLFLGSVLSFKEKTSQSRFRNALAAPPSSKVIIAQISSVVVLLYAQISVIAILFYVFFIKSLYLDLAIILMLLFLFLIVFVSIGIFIGQIAQSQLSLFISQLMVLFLLFLTSGVLLPLELLSSSLVSILEYTNPYLAMQNILRKILLFSVPLSSILFELIVLGVIFVVILIAIILMYSYSNRGEIYYVFNRVKEKKSN